MSGNPNAYILAAVVEHLLSFDEPSTVTVTVQQAQDLCNCSSSARRALTRGVADGHLVEAPPTTRLTPAGWRTSRAFGLSRATIDKARGEHQEPQGQAQGFSALQSAWGGR